MPSLVALLARARRRLLIHRRWLAAACVAAVVALSLSIARPPAPATVSRFTAARDLPSGTVLAPRDLRRTEFAPASVPDTAVVDLDTVVGRTLAVPLDRGELLTRSRVMSNDRLAGYPGRSAIALRIPDADVVGMLRVGDRVDLVATDPQRGGAPEHLVSGAPVVAVPAGSPAAAGTGMVGRLVVLAVPSGQVDHVADAGASRFLTVIWNR